MPKEHETKPLVLIAKATQKKQELCQPLVDFCEKYPTPIPFISLSGTVAPSKQIQAVKALIKTVLNLPDPRNNEERELTIEGLRQIKVHLVSAEGAGKYKDDSTLFGSSNIDSMLGVFMGGLNAYETDLKKEITENEPPTTRSRSDTSPR